MKLRAPLMLSVAFLVGCAQASEAHKPNPANSHPENRRSDDSFVLSNLLIVFAGPTGESWDAYDDVGGVHWHSAKRNEYAKGQFELAGRMTLRGFGTAKLPNGKVGIDYAEVEGNEGQSGVTLVGTKEHVAGFDVKKFYFSERYADILAQQLRPPMAVKTIASACHSEESSETDERRTFLQISGAGDVVYVEAWLEDGGKYSPGYTVFDFSRNEPAARIKQLRCSIL